MTRRHHRLISSSNVVDVAMQPLRELRHASRRLLAAPLFTLFSVATLALSIGLTTAIYSAMHRLSDDNPGVADGDGLFGLYWEHRPGSTVSLPDFRDIAGRQQTFSDLAAWTTTYTSIASSDGSDLVGGEIVTGTYFEMVGAVVALGRPLTPADDHVDAPAAIVLSDTNWRTSFHSDPAIVGRSLLVAGHPFTVVGIADPDFPGMVGRPWTAGFWVPLAVVSRMPGLLGSTTIDPANRNRPFLRLVGRLRPAASIEQASADLALIGARLDATFPLPRRSTATASVRVGRTWSAGPAFPPQQRPDQGPIRVIIGLPALVFLIACTNLANLALSRGVARRGSLVVRQALGAPRWRLVREEMGEALLITVVGALAGLGLARLFLTTWLGYVQYFTSVPSYILPLDLGVSPAVFLPVACATLLALVVGGLLPAMQLSRIAMRQALNTDNGTSLPRWRGRSNLIALQVGASVGLFLVAFAASQVLTSRVLREGYPLDGIAAAGIPFDRQPYSEARARETLERVLADVRRAPGVTGAAVVAGIATRDPAVPSSYRRATASAADQPFTATNEGTSVNMATATADAFDVLGLPVVAGRPFTDNDSGGAPPVAVINEDLALEVFGTTNPVGRTLLVRIVQASQLSTQRDVTATVVGVVPVREPARDGSNPHELYLPFAQHYDPNVLVLARTGGDAPPVAALRTALRNAAPALAMTFLGDGGMLTDTQQRLGWLVMAIAHGLAAFALLLAMTGLYGVLSHIVTLRTRELALRVALGATSTGIVRLVFRDGLRPVFEGLLIGLGGAILVRQVIRVTAVSTIPAIEVIPFVLAAGLLVTAGIAACYLPARRASKVDPNVALKEL